MKNKQFRIIVLVLALTLMLAGCKKTNFGIVSNDDNTMTITAVNAPKDLFGGSGFITVTEGQKIVIDSTLNKKGEILLKFSSGPAADMDAAAAELVSSVSGENAVLEVFVKGPGTTEYEIAAGDYGLYAEVISKANGTVGVSVQ